MRKCIWLTGLPGVGKTTLAMEIQKMRPEVQVLDAEVMRSQFWPQLGNVPQDREKNCIRLAALAGMLMEHGAEVIVAAVSPDLHVREAIRMQLSKIGKFYSVLLVCDEQRKKLWPNTVYEEGDHDITLDTGASDRGALSIAIVGTFLRRPKRQLFVGRWQPFHAGHQMIIREALPKGPVAIGVRLTEIDVENPYSLDVRVKAIRETFDQGEDVVVFAVPDIASIHVGRDVGYEVHRAVPGVSGSALRAEGRQPKRIEDDDS